MTAYVYRHYDAWGRLLYIGFSMDVEARSVQHFQCSSWGGVIGRVDVARFENRQAALAAEKRAIAEEAPPYNRANMQFVPTVHVPICSRQAGDSEAIGELDPSRADAIRYAGSAVALATLLGVTKQAVSAWGDKLPPLRVFQLRQLRPGWFRRKV